MASFHLIFLKMSDWEIKSMGGYNILLISWKYIKIGVI